MVGGLKAVATGMAPVLGYNPESIKAAQGDTVVFVFMQKNHTATQSTFAEPCKKKEGGMDSGFMINPDGKPGVEWNMTVDTTEPLCKCKHSTHTATSLTWSGFYCKQKNGVHCGRGMVFSINAPSAGDKTMAAFKQLAIKQNGTEQAPLTAAAINVVQPGAAAAPTTVTILAGGANNAVATATGTGAATVATGTGTDNQGNSCTCQCLCGVNQFPAAAAVNNFGGFAGMLPASPMK
jgi:plastocyanin